MDSILLPLSISGGSGGGGRSTRAGVSLDNVYVDLRQIRVCSYDNVARLSSPSNSTPTGCCSAAQRAAVGEGQG